MISTTWAELFEPSSNPIQEAPEKEIEFSQCSLRLDLINSLATATTNANKDQDDILGAH